MITTATTFTSHVRLGVAAIAISIVAACASPSTPTPEVTAPAAPTITSITALDEGAEVAFTAPDDGGSEILNYEVSIDGGAFQALDPASVTSPIVVGGLTNDVEQTIALRAVNAIGTGDASAAAAVTPTALSVDMVVRLVITQEDVGGDTSTLTLPLAGTYDVTIDWGDGSAALEATDASDPPSHTYAAAGNVTLRISGSVQGFGDVDGFDGANLITDVRSWGTELGLGSLAGALKDATNLVAVPSWLPSTVTDLSFLFDGATTFDQDLNGWDTSNVTTLKATFQFATVFDGAIDAWDTGSVTNLSFTFGSAKAFDQDISSWNVGAVTNMQATFQGADAFNQPIGAWSTGSVTRMDYMFNGADAFDQELAGFDTSNVTNMTSMFQNAAAFDRDISGWCVSNIGTEPTSFTTPTSALREAFKPDWGAACP